jgi:hypothetical protein
MSFWIAAVVWLLLLLPPPPPPPPLSHDMAVCRRSPNEGCEMPVARS